ncbi:MAG: hypothetical protein AAGK14_05845, partial [Verrucomicrobiota bacterium]
MSRPLLILFIGLMASLVAGCGARPASQAPAPVDPAERLVAYWQLDVDYTEAEWDRSDANRLPEDADGEDIKAFAENLAV